MSTIAGFGRETDIDLLRAVIHIFPPHLMRKLLSRTKHTKKREKVKLCVRLGNPSPLLPTNAVVHCESGKHEQCFSRKRQAQHRYQGSASRPHRNQNHHIRVLTGKTGSLAALWRHAFKSNYTVAVQEAERIQHPNHLCQDQCCTVWFCYRLWSHRDFPKALDNLGIGKPRRAGCAAIDHKEDWATQCISVC